MSIALENNRIGFIIRRSKMRPCNNLSSIIDHKDDKFVRVDVDDEIDNGSIVEQCSSSSSIGKNSDNDDVDENEVQSKLDNNPLDSLEQALPIRRGISKFYNGKSKSFASLSNATCTSSIKDIAKPENAYTRKRKNLLAYGLLYGRTSLLKCHGIGGGITKRPIHTSRSTLPLAISMSSSDSSIDENVSSPEINQPYESMTWRSFSVVDLQQCAVNSNFTSPMIGKISKSDEVA